MASPHLMLLGFIAFHALDGTRDHACAKEALFQGALSPTPVDDLVLAFLFCASTGCLLLGCLSLLWEVLLESSACTVCSHGPLLFSFSRDLCGPVSHPGHWFRTGSSGSRTSSSLPSTSFLPFCPVLGTQVKFPLIVFMESFFWGLILDNPKKQQMSLSLQW